MTNTSAEMKAVIDTLTEENEQLRQHFQNFQTFASQFTNLFSASRTGAPSISPPAAPPINPLHVLALSRPARVVDWVKTVSTEYEGEVYFRDQKEYDDHCYQYAFSSEGTDGSMHPAIIIYPKNDDDVKKALYYAREKNVAVAVRTGGHEYLGASSTSGDNIQLDMSKTYVDFSYDAKTGLVTTGISHSLRDFNALMGEENPDMPDKPRLFVPHGQCSHVHIGGHVQSGGYGQLGRSFGLFADHVVSFRIIMADGTVKDVPRNSLDPSLKDIFYGVLGGSPGNFGILTHLTIKPELDSEHEKSRGMKLLYIYTREKLQKLLDVMVEMSDGDTLPGEYDFCITVVSYSQLIIPHLFHESIDEQMRSLRPDLYGDDDNPAWPPMIVVYAQWANPGPAGRPYHPAVFKKIKDAGGWVLRTELDDDKEMNMSDLTKQWIFGNVREFPLPYVKRTYMTNSTNLAGNKWSEWVSGRIDEIQSGSNRCKLSIQIQYFGGSQSQYRQKGQDKATAFSWRDSNICCVLDCFYDRPGVFSRIDPRDQAKNWQAQNDREGVGSATAKFCDKDRRVLWGCYGSKNMEEVWQYYYESKEQYDRLCKIKDAVDPRGVFTPNSFCVGGARIAHSTVPRISMAAGVPLPVVPEPPAIPPQWTDPRMDDERMSQKLIDRRTNMTHP